MFNWSKIKNILITFRQPIGLALLASVGIHTIVEFDWKQKLGSQDISQDWPARLSVPLSGLSIKKAYLIEQADLSKLVAIGVDNLPLVLGLATNFEQSLIKPNQDRARSNKTFIPLTPPGQLADLFRYPPPSEGGLGGDYQRGAVGGFDPNQKTHQIPEPKSEFNMTLPIANNVRITSEFGWRNHPIFKRKKNFHSGIDFGSPTGTPVLAVYSGKVESAGWRGGYGLTVILEHQKGTAKKQTLYAHLSKVLVKKGELVEPGNVIGHVGSTGYSTGSHLHLELRKRIDGKWKPIDPTPYLKAAIAEYQQEQQRAWFNETILSHQEDFYKWVGNFTQSLTKLIPNNNK
jgi:murein DD-endopeptidase MepM/ murein hydrolase activator NlpD